MEDNNKHLNSKSKQRQDLIAWRRDQTWLLSSQGCTQRDIADRMKVSLGTVNQDITFMQKQAKEKIQHYLDDKLPGEYDKALTGLNWILRESVKLSENAEDTREKIQALSLAKECYSMKLDLLTNSSVVNDSIRFIEKSKKFLDSNNNKMVNNENNDIQGISQDNRTAEATATATVF